MRLKELLYGTDYEILMGTEDEQVEDLSCSSQECSMGCVFFAIKGRDANGYAYINEAVENGACVVVADRPALETDDWPAVNSKEQITVVAVEDARATLAAASRNFFGRPDEGMTIIGVTGTKGKTTTSCMIFEVLKEAGRDVGIIGTLGSKYMEREKHFPNTTPEPYSLYEELRRMADGGCKIVVMEVSSQGLKHHRVDGINFDIAVFTNIHVDHIGKGEHESFLDYARSKRKIFDRCKLAVVNSDDVLSEYMVSGLAGSEIVTFGMKTKADFCAEGIRCTDVDESPGIRYVCTHGLLEADVNMSLPGNFSVSNSLAAIAVCSVLKVDFMKCCESVGKVKVRGRLEPVKLNGFPEDYKIFVDYAHNGASLKALLKVLRGYADNRLITVFGCGGQRDVRRRIEMGQAAAQYADLSVITSDNPRSEKPMDIIYDIIHTVEEVGGKYIAIEKRRDAIRWALANAEKGDIIVVAGKGHEAYQIIGNKTLHFDDKEEILDFIKQKNGNNIL